MTEEETLFPAIGEIAEKTDQVLETETSESAVPENDDDRPVQEIESYCVNCGDNGITRLLLTSIPFFREIIVMSFRCEHCGFENNEVQSAGSIRDHGTAYTVRILSREDLDRQLVKSASCTVIIPEYALTIPPAKGQLTTVEGILRDTVSDLDADQPLRRIQAEEAYTKIQAIINAFKEILGDEDDDAEEEKKDPTVKVPKKDLPMKPFTITLDDPAGNSFIEFKESMSDPKWNMRTYKRTKEHNVMLGLATDDNAAGATSESQTAVQGGQDNKEALRDKTDSGESEAKNEEIFVFPGTCSSCGAPVDTRMKNVNIPYFKDIIIMSTNCDHCGYRDNEVKSGGAISEKGKRITLKVEEAEDLSRDILKSETCGMSIPEIDLVLQEGTLGGRFTTLEGILDQIYEELADKVFASGDSIGGGERKTFEKFLGDLKAVKAAERPFTVILEDPLANSYLQNIYAPDLDPNMTIELFDRTWEQNEELGLNDMRVEGYEETVVEDGRTES